MRRLLGYKNNLYTAHGDQDGAKAMLEHAFSHFSSITLEIMDT